MKRQPAGICRGQLIDCVPVRGSAAHRDERGMADEHIRRNGDGVVRTGRPAANRDAEIMKTGTVMNLLDSSDEGCGQVYNRELQFAQSAIFVRIVFLVQ
jgi:hypothetical protein